MDKGYQTDSDTNVLIDCLSNQIPLDEPFILKFPAVYRTAIARNQSGLLEDRLVYYDQIIFATKNSFALSFLYHFFANQLISCMPHLLLSM